MSYKTEMSTLSEVMEKLRMKNIDNEFRMEGDFSQPVKGRIMPPMNLPL